MSKQRAPRPTYRSPATRYWDWAAIAREARRHPGTWWLVAGSVSPAAVRAVNTGRLPAWLRPGLRAEGRNPHLVDGKPAVDFYIRWTPEEP